MIKLVNSFVAGAMLSLAACTFVLPPSPKEQVSKRLAQYAEFFLHQDVAALSGMFESSGLVAHEGQPAVIGREAIASFFQSFKSYTVLSHKMNVESAVARDGTVEQTGTFEQSVRAPDGETLQVEGKFAAVWRREKAGDWLIQSMRTAPKVGH